MFGLLEGIFGILRPGLLSERDDTEKLDSLIGKLSRIPNWGLKIAAIARPEATGSNADRLAIQYEYLLQHIVDTKDQVSVPLIRRYTQMVEQLIRVTKMVKAPKPEPAPPPPPPPPPKPEPVPVPEKLPPPPPGLKCPHYTKSSAFPANWNDPAAVGRYLKANTDVKLWVDAMAKRKYLKGSLDALWHYRCYGQKEGRTWAGWGGLKPSQLGDLLSGVNTYTRLGNQRPGYL